MVSVFLMNYFVECFCSVLRSIARVVALIHLLCARNCARPGRLKKKKKETVSCLSGNS